MNHPSAALLAAVFFIVIFFVIRDGLHIFEYISLEEYWARPLPPNGKPPEGYSPLESSLSPESCGKCHLEQYNEWKTSLHAKALSTGVLWQLHKMDQLSANKCLDCHAPLAEQKALMAIRMNWEYKPTEKLPQYVDPDLDKNGVICAACHVRKHVRYGPPPGHTYTASAHNGFRIRAFFEDSKFCIACHRSASSEEKTNGKLRMNTYEEWLSSSYSKKGITCQKCHMPQRRHLWRGIHDESMVRKAMSLKLNLENNKLLVTIKNVGAGHKLPTYMVPKIYIKLYQGETLLKEFTIGWMVDALDLSKEIFDRRIPPDSSISFYANIPDTDNSKSLIKLVVEVDPKEHYIRAFTTYLEKNKTTLDPYVSRLIQTTIEEFKKQRYVLIIKELTIKDLREGVILNGEPG